MSFEGLVQHVGAMFGAPALNEDTVELSKANNSLLSQISYRGETHLGVLQERSEWSRRTSPPLPNNHEYLTASGPISLMLCRYVPLPPAPPYTHIRTHSHLNPLLHCRARAVFGALTGEAGLNCRCFQDGVDSLRTPGSALGTGCGGGRTVRYLTGVCYPLAPSGAAESAPYSQGPAAKDRGVFTPSSGCLERRFFLEKTHSLLLSYDWLRRASAVS
ncbi:hypothetical protein GOODEAATRI_002711 [Goodea atripinnis]|uniref:Uncharacterized protein n=1 Tax=Goodea atripinnis TaxID=208336 RepID=A0ABV0NGY5_9TELE